MIASVRGTVLTVQGATAVIEVNGVGMAVQVTPQQALALGVGTEAMLRTALVVREDDLSLFGFADAEELVVFDLLRGVTGVGPKSAMGVLAAMTPSQIAVAVAEEDDAAFRRVSGIGPKTAKLIVVSLAGKLAVPASAPTPVAAPVTVRDDVAIALVGLGWPEKVAAQAVEQALATAGDAELAVPALLRLALAELGPQQAVGA
ncbi:MAG TPA: Holliday junction branch migration protein RuvA [Rhodoglobus sp.]|nr:Holliday junction branch migration protein RuvA [Rhodoglobus sp.]